MIRRRLRVYRVDFISSSVAQFLYSDAGKTKYLNVPVKNRELDLSNVDADLQLKGHIRRFYNNRPSTVI